MRSGRGKKVVALLLCVILAVALAAPIAQAKEAYDYPTKDMWYQKYTTGWLEPGIENLYDHHKLMGMTGFDIDNIINSKMGESIVNNLYPIINYSENEMASEVVQYWADRGLKKELKNPGDADHKWAVYTPTDASLPGNEDKKYPVVFVFHGNTDTIFYTEGFGFTHLAARDKFICVIPWATNGTTLDADMDAIWAELQANYPMDESRVYATGFSLGGRSTVLQATRTPNRYAALGVGGQHLAGSNSVNAPIPDETWNAMKETPVIAIAGTMDRNNHFPYGQKNALQTNSLNTWFRINGIDRSFTQAECQSIAANSTNLVERKLGLTADEEYIQYFDGNEHYTGDYYNAAGVNMMKMVAIEGLPHILTGSLAEISWEFMTRFARDPETKELIVLDDPDVKTRTVKAGDTIMLPITAKDAKLLAGIKGEIQYDSELLTLQGVSASGKFMMTAEDNRFVAVSKDGLGLSGDVVVGYAIFEANADLSDDVTTPVSFPASKNMGFLEDEDMQTLNMPSIELGILSEDALIGDVNLDGKVDVADAIALMQYLAGSKTLTAKQLRAAEVNKDGKVNVGDITIIMQMCL